MGELKQIESAPVTQDLKQFMTDQELMFNLAKRCEQQRQDLEKLRDENTSLKLKLSTSNIHICNFLDETEAKFDNDETFDSTEAALDYLDAAIYQRDYFGRVNNFIDRIQNWYDNYLPYGQ